MAKLTYTGAEVQALLDKVNELAGHKGILLVDGEQVVTGIKNFINGLQVGGKLVKYDTATNAFVFPANAIFEGGIAWNTKLEGFEEQSITAAVQVDWKTIGKNENGELYVIGGTSSGGGGVVGGVTLDEVKNYLTGEKYTTEAWVSSQNYATQSWVTNKGYITGITGSMVTSALGYTPFNSANFTKAKIKSTLGISDWALESVKPPYKFSEITNKPTTLSGYGITDAYNKTEIGASLKTITDNLNTKASSVDVASDIATAKAEALEEAATSASEALEIRVGAIPADTTIKSYIDTAVGSGGTASAEAIAAAKQEAISTSKTYTDEKIVGALAIVEF